MPQNYKIPVRPNKSVEIFFTIGSTEKITTRVEKCIEAEDYDWNACVLDYIFSETGCALNWFVATSFPSCKHLRELRTVSV